MRQRHIARYGKGFILLPEGFDLLDDAKTPCQYYGDVCTSTGLLLGRGAWVRVDHEATGTHTGGTGDTVCRRVTGDD